MVKYSPWIEVMVYLGVIGGGAQDYFGYVGMLREKAWGMLGWTDRSQAGPPPEISAEPENVARGKKWLLPAQVDMSLSVVAILIFTGAFVVLGATVLHPNHVIPDGFTLLTEQAAFLTHLVGEQGGVRLVVDWLYRTGIFFAFFGTILGAYEIFVRTVREAVIAIWPTTEGVPLTKFRAWVLLYVGGGGLAILWTGVDPRLIVVPAALVGSGLICGLWCFAMLWSDRAHLPRPLRMPMLLKVALFLSGAVLTVGPSIGIWKYSQDMLIPYLRGDAIVPEGSELELLFTRTLDIEGGLTEGPAAAPDGSIYFTDITPGDSGGKIMRFNPATGETSVFVEDSRKANGLAFDNQGRLVACEGADFGGRCISRYDLATGEREVLVDRYEGKRLNAPNDLCIDSKGRIYFTDPKYVGPEERELDQFAVYRLNPDKTLALVTDNIEKPNGVALSPDERTLYVADTNNGTDQIEASEPANPPQLGAMKVYAFALDRQGHPKGQRKTLVDFKPEQGCDGMTVDSEGRIYLSVRSLARPGVLVIDSNGKEVAFISTGPAKQQTAASPQGIPSNVEFGVGDDANVLYITIDQGLQRIRLNSHRAQANVSAN
jgi:gluconolactonase